MSELDFLDNFGYHTISIYRTIVLSLAHTILAFFLDHPYQFHVSRKANVVDSKTSTKSAYYTIKYINRFNGRNSYAHIGITWVIRIVNPADGGYWVKHKRDMILNDRLSRLFADMENPADDCMLDVYVDDADIDCCMLKAIINPKVLVDGMNYLDTADESTTDHMIRLFDQACSMLSTDLFGHFADYKLSRIDYCVNVDCSELIPLLVMKNVSLLNIDVAELYMILIEQSDIPRSYTMYGPLVRMGSYRPKTQHSYYVKNRSVRINFYWKSVRLRGAKRCDSASVIRLEVQCLYPKVKSLGGGGDDWIGTMLKSDLSRDVVMRYWKRVVGMGDWYSLPEAKKRVMASNRRADFKRGMCDVLDLVNRYHGVTKAKTVLLKGKTISERESVMDWFSKYVKGLDELGINPVTIGVGRGISYMPNLLKLVCDR